MSINDQLADSGTAISHLEQALGGVDGDVLIIGPDLLEAIGEDGTAVLAVEVIRRGLTAEFDPMMNEWRITRPKMRVAS